MINLKEIMSMALDIIFPYRLTGPTGPTGSTGLTGSTGYFIIILNINHLIFLNKNVIDLVLFK
jgi:hypothetical protein